MAPHLAAEVRTDTHRSRALEARITFPLLAVMPPRGAISRSYGVYREPEALTAWALFILERSGIVRFGEVYPDLLNPGVDDLFTVLEGLAAEENTGV